MDESAIRRVVESVLSDSAFRASHGLGGFGPSQRDQLDILTAQMAQLMSDRSLQAAIGNQLWMDGVSIIDGTVTAPKIDVVQLSAVAILTGDLTINGVLTLGAGGRIEDADGSVWDQDGIFLAATASLSDVINFIRTGFTNQMLIEGYVDTADCSIQMRAYDSDGVDEAAIRLYSGPGNDDNIADLEAIGGSGITRFRVRGDGNFIFTNLPSSSPGISGAIWSDGGTLKVS